MPLVQIFQNEMKTDFKDACRIMMALSFTKTQNERDIREEIMVGLREKLWKDIGFILNSLLLILLTSCS